MAEHDRGVNEAALRKQQRDQVRAGTRAQRAVLPGHFHAGASELNRRGERTLATLLRSEAGLAGPAPLRVPRGGVSATLHEARLETVREALSGTEVSVVGGRPSPEDGVRSARVRKMLEKARGRVGEALADLGEGFSAGSGGS
jgi:hypothetical protein